MRRNSLAFRLVATSAGWSVILLAIAGLLISSLFRSAVERAFDERLVLTLDGLLANIEFDTDGELSEAESLGDTRYILPLQGWYWQVSVVADPDAQDVRSTSLLEKTLTFPPTAFGSRDANGLSRFYHAGPEGHRLRVIEQKYQLDESDRRLSFVVTGNGDELDAEIGSFNQILFATLVILALGLVMAVLIQVWFGIQPLRRLRDGLISVRSGRSERLGGDYPIELTPVVRELNALLQANEQIIERSRTQVGNLAHALKTPLSVIKNEADASGAPLSDKIVEQTEKMADQVQLYLDRARRAARAHALGTITQVQPVIRGLVRTLDRIYEDKSLSIDVECSDGVRFLGERQDLEETVGNLLDNAFKWASGTVRISAATLGTNTDDGEVRLIIVVEDDGPGLPEHQHDDALQRGKRLDETKPGSGLGLSIVEEIVGMYNGVIELGPSEQGGLRVTLTLPAATLQL